MTVNLAEKYSEKVDEKFKLASVTGTAVNNDYEFTGVNTVNVYSIPTVSMSNYSMSGSQRYGEPGELGNSVQTLALTKDRAFTFAIDRRAYDDAQMTGEAGKALARQIDEVVVPEIDIYRLSVMAAAAIGAENVGEGGLSKSTAYAAFLEGCASLTDNKVPLTGRIAYCSSDFYKLIKQDNSFVLASDLAQDSLIKGQLGMIDGVAIIVVPASYLPENCLFIITHPAACVSPVKLIDYKVHDNPPGINGWLIEGRVYYDAFILNNKAGAVYAHYTELPDDDDGDGGEGGEDGGEGGEGGGGGVEG